jgi:hypothetical protein
VRTSLRLGGTAMRAEFAQRTDAIEQFMQLRDATAVAAAAREIGLRWFLLKPGSRVGWPPEIASHPVFERDGFRLYRF